MIKQNLRRYPHLRHEVPDIFRVVEYEKWLCLCSEQRDKYVELDTLYHPGIRLVYDKTEVNRIYPLFCFHRHRPVFFYAFTNPWRE